MRKRLTILIAIIILIFSSCGMSSAGTTGVSEADDDAETTETHWKLIEQSAPDADVALRSVLPGNADMTSELLLEMSGESLC